jgi:hypothetical protein
MQKKKKHCVFAEIGLNHVHKRNQGQMSFFPIFHKFPLSGYVLSEYLNRRTV